VRILALHMYKGNVTEHGENQKQSALVDTHQASVQRQSPLVTDFNLSRNPEGAHPEGDQKLIRVPKQQPSFRINGPEDEEEDNQLDC
jgi:hypothetical protein